MMSLGIGSDSLRPVSSASDIRRVRRCPGANGLAIPAKGLNGMPGREAGSELSDGGTPPAPRFGGSPATAGFGRRHGSRQVRRRIVVPLPVFEEIQVAGPFHGHDQPVAGPLRDRREGLGRDVVRRGRGGILVVGVGEPRQRRRLDGEHVQPPPRVAALLEDRFRDVLVGPLPEELAGAAA